MRQGPEILRKYADALEDKRQMENVEICRHIPALDQRLLLALNKPRDGRAFTPPDAGTVTRWLQERVISIAGLDGQSVVLGLFFTNRTPFNKAKANIAVGIFPLYANVIDYFIRPDVNFSIWQSLGKFTVIDESAIGNDPFLVPNPKGLDFIFFRKSPFSDTQTYKTVLPDDSRWQMPRARLCDDALERNVIERALWYVNDRKKPRLFTIPGFENFMGKNRFDPQYIELYEAYRTSNVRLGRTFPQYNF